jgi:hypothetical protein
MTSADMTGEPDFDPAALTEHTVLISNALIRAYLQGDEIAVIAHRMAGSEPRWVLLNAIMGLTTAAAESLLATHNRDDILERLAKIDEHGKWIGITQRQDDQDPPFM